MDIMRPTLPVALSMRKQPLVVPDPGQRVRLRAGQGRWREGFRAVSEPYTAEAGEVVVWVAMEGEYWDAMREGRRAVGIPWPVRQVRGVLPASEEAQETAERPWWRR